MNVTEANRLNALLCWLLGPDEDEPQITDQDAMEYAAHLADRARLALGAGLDGERVRKLWQQRRPIVVHDLPPGGEPDRPRLLALVRDLADDDECWFDHHGYCQAHGWMTTETPCPHARARELLGSGDA